MTYLKKLFAIVLLAFVALSCSKDDNAEPELRTNLLVRSTDSDDGLTMDYTYDTTNRLINFKRNAVSGNPAEDLNFSYNADGSLNEVREATGNALRFKYFYSGTKVVKKEGRNGLDVYQYSYSGNTVIENYRFTTNNTGFRNIYTYDGNGNISMVEYYTNTSNANPLGTYAATVNQTFDNKRNAYSSLPEAYSFPASVNNLQGYQANGGPIVTTGYEYNADNYPTKRIEVSYNRVFEYRRL